MSDISLKKIAVIIAVAVVVAVCVGLMMVDNKTDKQQAESTETSFALNKDAMEEKCQALVDDEKYEVINTLDYNLQFNEYAYDEDGSQIVLVQWNGKDKITDEAVRFSCYISGKDSASIKVLLLSASGVDLYGDRQAMLSSLYYSDGSKME